jgi:hypothetical protein
MRGVDWKERGSRGGDSEEEIVRYNEDIVRE